MAEIFEETITLGPGASTRVGFSVTPTAARRYSVRVDGLTGSFEATAPVPGPADIVLSDLVITPLVVGIGVPVTISIIAINRGGTTGSKTVTLTVT